MLSKARLSEGQWKITDLFFRQGKRGSVPSALLVLALIVFL